ncbi:MAG: hypothetical protein ACRENP_04475 [Longimicrobiales bacterium]
MLAFIDGFPTLVEWCQVPAGAAQANYPEPTALSIKCEPASDRKVRDGFITAQIGFAEDAMAVHGGNS